MKPPGIDIVPIPDMAALQTIVAAALAAKRSGDTPRKTCWDARAESMACLQRLPYSSWRRHHMPDSLRPLGARSSH